MRKRIALDPSKRTLKILAGAAFVLALAWQHVQATRLGYEVERARRQAQALRGRIAAQHVDIERGLTPAQLARLAETKLGMLPAPPEAVRMLEGPRAAERGGLLGRLLSRWGHAPGRSPLAI